MRYRRTPIFLVDDETMLAESMKRAQDGDRQAYALVLERCRKAFTRLAHEQCPAEHSEIGIVHQCLLTLHHARHTFDPKRPFSGWVDAIARHHNIGRARIGSEKSRRRVWRLDIGMLAKGVMRIAGPPKRGTSV